MNQSCMVADKSVISEVAHLTHQVLSPLLPLQLMRLLIKRADIKIRQLKEELINTIKKNVSDIWVNGGQENCLPGIVSITFPKTDSEGLLLLLDAEGIACSTGSACSAGVQRPSHVLLAMGLTEDETTSTLRFSLSYTNTVNEIAKLGAVISTVVAKSRNAMVK